MQVFKAYFKIIRKHMASILLYFVVFVAVSLIITSILGNTGTAAFNETKASIAVFNEDAGSPIAEGLKDYLAKLSNIVDVPDDKESIEDALFGGNISYVLRVPSGFTSDFLGGKNGVSLEKTAVSGSNASVGLDFYVERYLNIAGLYARNAPELTAAQIAGNVAKDLDNKSAITVNTYGSTTDTNYIIYYFRYLAYTIIAVMIMGVSTFMMAMNDTDLSNRNQCSPVTPLRMNLQIVLGNVVFAVVVWAAMCALVFLVYGKVPQGPGSWLLCLNALVMTVVGLSMGFLAGKFIRNPGVQSAVTNVVSLGISFISGVFVEQAMLGKTVLGLSKFLPGYWYVKAVDDIRNIAVFNLQSVLPVLYGMLIQLGFAAVIFIVAMVVSKQIKLQREI